MPTYKVDYVLEQFNGSWSETFYYTSDRDMPTILASAVSVAPLRAACFSSQCRMLEVRISDVDVLGDSLIDTSVQGIKNTNRGPGDVLNSGVRVRLNAGNRHRRNYIMRGWPDQWIALNTLMDGMYLTTDGMSALTPWLRAIGGSDPYQLKCVAKPGENIPGSKPPGAPTATPVLSLATGDATNRTTSVIAAIPGLPLPPGTRIQLRAGRKSVSAANGTWPIVTSTDASANIPLPWTSISGFNPGDATKLTVNILTVGFLNITNPVYNGITTRKTGRPFDRPRGRAKTRAR